MKKIFILFFFILTAAAAQAIEPLNCNMNVSLESGPNGYSAGNKMAKKILRLKGYHLFENLDSAPFKFQFGLLGAGDINGNWRFQWFSHLNTNANLQRSHTSLTLFDLDSSMAKAKIAHALRIPSCKKMYRQGLVN